MSDVRTAGRAEGPTARGELRVPPPGFQPDTGAPRAGSAVERWRDRVLVVAFALGLAFPLTATVAGWGGGDAASEKRVLTPFPPLAPDAELRAEVEAQGGGELAAWSRSIQAWPKEYEAYYDDHFPYRSDLIHWHHRLYYQGLGVSPRPDVVLGRDGWLFTNAADQEQAALDQVRGLHPFAEEQLREWQRFLEECRDWFADRGVPFYVTIAPSKPSIHGEYLPDWIEVRGAQTRLDQLADWLAAAEERDGRPPVPLVDLRPALLAAKAEHGPLYRRTDTHWNGVGALIASDALLDALRPRFPSLPELSVDDYDVRRFPGTGGDLAANLSLAQLIGDDLVALKPRVPVELVREVEGLAPVRIPEVMQGFEANLEEERQRPFRLVQPGVDLPRLLMFRDSYASNLVPFLSRGFASSAYYWQYRIHDPAIMATERPDVVVQQIGERVLMRNVGLPRNEPFLVRDLAPLRAFRDEGVSVVRREATELGPVTLELPFEGLPPEHEALVRVAGDFPAGGAVRARLFPPAEGHPGWELKGRDVIAWRDVVYLRIPGAKAVQRLRVEVDAEGARDVVAEVRGVPRAPEAQ